MNKCDLTNKEIANAVKRLEQLAEMGVLSPDELASKKSRLIDKMLQVNSLPAQGGAEGPNDSCVPSACGNASVTNSPEIIEFTPQGLFDSLCRGGFILLKARRVTRAEAWKDRVELCFRDGTTECLLRGKFDASQMKEGVKSYITITNNGKTFRIFKQVMASEDDAKYERLAELLGAEESTWSKVNSIIQQSFGKGEGEGGGAAVASDDGDDAGVDGGDEEDFAGSVGADQITDLEAEDVGDGDIGAILTVGGEGGLIDGIEVGEEGEGAGIGVVGFGVNGEGGGGGGEGRGEIGRGEVLLDGDEDVLLGDIGEGGMRARVGEVDGFARGGAIDGDEGDVGEEERAEGDASGGEEEH
jgi:hypothetical protein